MGFFAFAVERSYVAEHDGLSECALIYPTPKKSKTPRLSLPPSKLPLRPYLYDEPPWPSCDIVPAAMLIPPPLTYVSGVRGI